MYIISSLIPFDMVLDTDFGIIKFMQFTTDKSDDIYENMYPGILDMKDVKYDGIIKRILSERSNPNPMMSLFKPEFADIGITVYDSVMKNYYEDIVKLSAKTALFDMVSRSVVAAPEDMKFSILCKNQLEQATVRKAFRDNDIHSIGTVLSENLDSINDYGSIYVKNVYDLYDNEDKIEGKNIIIADYKFNLESDGVTPLMSQVRSLVSLNKIHTVNLYDLSEVDLA